MNDQIKRPLVVFDLETTGLDKQKDYIIQFAAIKVNQETGEIIDSKNLYIKPNGNYTISIQAYFKHGLKPEDLMDKPTLVEVADEILSFFEGCDILTYNGCSFDNSFLATELARNNKEFSSLNYNCYDAFLEEKRRNGNQLGQTYQRYTGKTMEEAGLQAHDALSDVKATYEIFKAQQEQQPYGPEHIISDDNFIVEKEFRGQQIECFNVGKYRDLSVEFVASIDQNYLNWCINGQNTISKSTKKFIKKFIN